MYWVGLVPSPLQQPRGYHYGKQLNIKPASLEAKLTGPLVYVVALEGHECLGKHLMATGHLMASPCLRNEKLNLWLIRSSFDASASDRSAMQITLFTYVTEIQSHSRLN